MSLNSNLKQRPYTSPEGHTFNPDTGEWTMPAADHLPIREDKTAEIKITATHKSTGETKVFDLSSILCSIGSQWIGEELAWLPKNYDELIITVKQ